MASRYLIILLFVLSSPFCTAQNTWEPIGPWGLTISQLERADDGTLYARGHDLLYRLLPGDTVWERMYAFETTDTRRLFLYKGVLLGFSEWSRNWVSFDRGETWERGEGFKYDGRFHTASVAAIGDTIFFTGPSRNRVLRMSIDSGRTWQFVDSLEWPARLATDGKHLYAAGIHGGIWIRDSTGWSDINDMPYPCASLMVQGDTLICLADVGDWDRGHYRSYNRGENWDTLAISLMIGERVSGDRLWGIHPLGSTIYSMPLWGDEWIPYFSFTAAETPPAPCCLAESGDTVYLGSGVGVFRQRHEADQFTNFSVGLDFLPIIWFTVIGDSLVVDGYGLHAADLIDHRWTRRGHRPISASVIDNGFLYGIGNEGKTIYKSSDRGVTVDSTAPIGAAEQLEKLHVSGDVILATSDDSLHRSTDGGRTWSGSRAICDVSSFLGSGDTVFATCFDLYDGLMVYSQDAGVSWDTIHSTRSIPIRSLAYANGHLYLGTNDTGLIRISDLGSTWKRIDPWKPAWGVDSLVSIDVIRAFGDTLVMFARARHKGDTLHLFVSRDAGESWLQLPYPTWNGRKLASFVHFGLYGNTLYGSTRWGIIYKRDVDFSLTSVDSHSEPGAGHTVVYDRGTLLWNVPVAQSYRIDIFDSRGVWMGTLDEGVSQPGRNVSKISTNHFPSGFYVCVLQLDGKLYATTPITVTR